MGGGGGGGGGDKRYFVSLTKKLWNFVELSRQFAL